MTPTCTARIYGCPATPDWSQWKRAELAGTGPHTGWLVAAALVLIVAGVLVLVACRPRGWH